MDKQYKFVYVNLGHYYLSFVIENEQGNYIYVSIPDVRNTKNEWLTDILYRTMKHKTDWTGGKNNYTTLQNFAENIEELFKRGF